MLRKIWITWEWQRRSIELSRSFGCQLFVLEKNGLMRYPALTVKTLRILASEKPDILFVQNPSMILATVACLYKLLISKTILVIDRHSNFMFTCHRRSIAFKLLFKILSNFTIKFADITMVTNEYIAEIIKNAKGNSFILPDKIPELKHTELKNLKGKINILLISSFGDDEPIEEAVEAMRHLIDNGIYLYITGNYKKIDQKIVNTAPNNVIFTGFLDEPEFVNMLFSVDAVMVLTTIENCMLCGCYEAMAASKPLITSKKRVLEEYFQGGVFVDNSVEGICDSIRELCKSLDSFSAATRNSRSLLEERWRRLFTSLEGEIQRLSLTIRT